MNPAKTQSKYISTSWPITEDKRNSVPPRRWFLWSSAHTDLLWIPVDTIHVLLSSTEIWSECQLSFHHLLSNTYKQQPSSQAHGETLPDLICVHFNPNQEEPLQDGFCLSVEIHTWKFLCKIYLPMSWCVCFYLKEGPGGWACIFG